MIDAVYLIAGFVLLMAGGDLLVRGAVATARTLGLSPLLIGLTLVGFGTSMPELATSVQAAIAGSPGIAVGNIVGSNIANILLILGIAALLTPIAVDARTLRRDGLLVVAVSAIFAVASVIMPLGRMLGFFFIAGLVGYIVYAYRTERSVAAKNGATAEHTAAYEKAAAVDEIPQLPGIDHATSGPPPATGGGSLQALAPSLLMALLGLAIVVLGGKLLVDGATALARTAGISETVIGLTIIAVGTSLPELVTTLVAAYRRHADVALGNVLGSNIYNILGIGGVTAVISPTIVPAEIAGFDNLVMLGASALMLVFAYTGRRIARSEGLVFVAGYAAYIAYIWPH